MYELLYCSFANEDLTANDITDILKTSHKWNSLHGITGSLLYYDNQFIQIIEGEKQEVKDLYCKIQNDIRHKNVVLLGENEKKNRFFDTWSMAFKELSLSDMDNIDKVLSINNFITYNSFDYKLTKAMKLFCTLAKEPFKKLTLGFE